MASCSTAKSEMGNYNTHSIAFTADISRHAWVWRRHAWGALNAEVAKKPLKPGVVSGPVLAMI